MEGLPGGQGFDQSATAYAKVGLRLLGKGEVADAIDDLAQGRGRGSIQHFVNRATEQLAQQNHEFRFTDSEEQSAVEYAVKGLWSRWCGRVDQAAHDDFQRAALISPDHLADFVLDAEARKRLDNFSETGAKYGKGLCHIMAVFVREWYLTNDQPRGVAVASAVGELLAASRRHASDVELLSATVTAAVTEMRQAARTLREHHQLEHDRPVRVLRKPPALVPVEVRDRGADVDAIRRLMNDDTVVATTLIGPVGSGKTAILSSLFMSLEATPIGFDSIDYIAARGPLSLTAFTVVNALTQAISEPDRREALAGLLRTRSVNWLDRVEEVIGGITRPHLLVIDQAEEALDEGGEFLDAPLNRLVEELADRTDHQISLLIVSSQPIASYLVGHKSDAVYDLETGLDQQGSAQLLDDLMVRLLVKPPPHQVEQILTVADGHPRLLELLVACLALEEGASLNELETSMRSHPLGPAAGLVARILTRLGDDEVLVAAALAMLGTPSDSAAIREVLDHALSGFHIETTLTHLADVRFVRHSTVAEYYIPSGVEAREVLEGLAVRGGSRPDVQTLRLAAADTLARLRESVQVRSVEDLAPHFREIQLRMDASQVSQALELMEALDVGYLSGWGYSCALTPWRRQLVPEIDDPYPTLSNFVAIANAAIQQERYQEALECLDSTANTRPSAPIWTALTLDRLRGDALLEWGKVEQARAVFDQALATSLLGLTGPERHRVSAVARARYGVLRCQAEMGEFGPALAQIETIRQESAPALADDRQLAATLTLAEAGALRCLGEFVEALDRADEARLQVPADRPLLVARCWDSLAVTRLVNGQVDKAVAAAENASRAVAQTGVADVARQANGTLALAYLAAEREDEAVRSSHDAIRFSRSWRELSAHLIHGIVAYRTQDRPGARASFDATLRNAMRFQAAHHRNYQVLDAIALAYTGLYLLHDRLAYEDAETAFTQARSITAAAGVSARIGVLFDMLTPDATAELTRLRRIATAGLAERPAPSSID